LIKPDATVRDAMNVLNETALQIALVVGADFRFLGTITDGDIRRAILKGAQATDLVVVCTNHDAVTGIPGMRAEDAFEVMRRLAVRALPIISDDGRIHDLLTLDLIIQKPRRDTPVLIMAGGRGERLRPITDATPKPLLSIAGEPLIEILIRQLAQQGFHKISISLHYKAEDFIASIGHGSDYGIQIKYIIEESPQGTAGAVRNVDVDDAGDPILVCNSDLVHAPNFGQLIDFHINEAVEATIAVSSHSSQIPYSVIEADKGRLVRIQEKPKRVDLVGAGIYVVNKRTVQAIAPQASIDMPQVFQWLLDSKIPVGIHELHGYWLDIGSISSLTKARTDH